MLKKINTLAVDTLALVRKITWWSWSKNCKNCVTDAYHEEQVKGCSSV